MDEDITSAVFTNGGEMMRSFREFKEKVDAYVAVNGLSEYDAMLYEVINFDKPVESVQNYIGFETSENFIAEWEHSEALSKEYGDYRCDWHYLADWKEILFGNVW